MVPERADIDGHRPGESRQRVRTRARLARSSRRSPSSSTTKPPCSTSGGSTSGWPCSTPRPAEYVIPGPEDLSDDPATTLHLVHDSMATLSGRIRRLKSKHAHAESPRSRTRRQIGNVRVWQGPGDLISRSVFDVIRVRGGVVDRFVGTYEHQLLPNDDEDTPWLIGRRRVLIDHDIEAGGGSLSFLL